MCVWCVRWRDAADGGERKIRAEEEEKERKQRRGREDRKGNSKHNRESNRRKTTQEKRKRTTPNLHSLKPEAMLSIFCFNSSLSLFSLREQ